MGKCVDRWNIIVSGGELMPKGSNTGAVIHTHGVDEGAPLSLATLRRLSVALAGSEKSMNAKGLGRGR